MHVEKRLDGTLAVRFQDCYLGVGECVPQPKTAVPANPTKPRPKAPAHRTPSEAARKAISGIARSSGLPVWKAAQINRMRTP